MSPYSSKPERNSKKYIKKRYKRPFFNGLFIVYVGKNVYFCNVNEHKGGSRITTLG